MAGILVLAFYGLFWRVCWAISGRFHYEQAKNPLRRRKWICFWFLMIPMYFHAFEFVFLMNECSKSPVYFPEEKIERPNILITNAGTNDNIGTSFRGASKFDYMISPEDLGYDSVNLNNGRRQFADYVVYQDVLKRARTNKNVVVGKERLEILKDANFALYGKIKRAWSFVWYTIYIYDYKNKRKIAGFREVSQVIDSSSFRNFLTLVRMPECTYNHGKYKSRDVSTKLLIENTFTKGR